MAFRGNRNGIFGTRRNRRIRHWNGWLRSSSSPGCESHIIGVRTSPAVNGLTVMAFWVIFVAGFSPIPYKVFTIAAGVAALNPMLFL